MRNYFFRLEVTLAKLHWEVKWTKCRYYIPVVDRYFRIQKREDDMCKYDKPTNTIY